MKRWKLAAIVAAALSGACGPESSSQQAAQTAQTASCSLRVEANPDAISRAVALVSDGSLDPCAGSLSNRNAYEAQVVSIDRDDDAWVEVVFAMRLRHAGGPMPLRP